MMHRWGFSSRTCSCPPPKAGLFIINQRGSGHCKNILFEQCTECIKDAIGKNYRRGRHADLLKSYLGKDGYLEAGVLLYGYSVKEDGSVAFNSMTLNGGAGRQGYLPDEYKDFLL